MGGVIIEGLEGKGVVQKPAKLVAVKGTYYLAIGDVRKELPVGIIPAADLAKLVGKEVTAITAGRNVIAIVGPGIKLRPWPCYIPVPNLFKQIQLDVQQLILDKFVDEGIITKAVAERLANVR